MHMVQRLSALFALSSCGVFGQLSAAKPSFEVADIKPSNVNTAEKSYFTINPGGVFVAHNAQIDELFEYAFKIRRAAIIGAPSWFDADRVDITAKATPTTSDDDLRLMVQSFLISEFKILLHTDQKPTSAFVLVVGKSGAKLHRSAGNGRADCKRATADLGIEGGGVKLACTNMKIAELAAGLPDLVSGYIDRPVMDGTGLTDAYDFNLEWVRRKFADQNGGPTIFTAVEKLGFKFEQRKISLPVIVIDKMERLR